MPKKYFVKSCREWTADYDKGEYEVTPEQYAKMASRESLAVDAAAMERIFENATYDTLVCGSIHMFWTKEE